MRIIIPAVGAVALILATPSAALAKSDYSVTISGRQIRADTTVTVTVTMGDDGGIDDGTAMCLFQIVGDHAPVPHTTVGHPTYAIPAGSRLVKLADCQRPAPDAERAGQPDYYSGSTTYKLRVSSNGWLALAAFREERHTRVDTGGPILSNIVPASGSAKPAAAAAKVTVTSISPPDGVKGPPGTEPTRTESTESALAESTEFPSDDKQAAGTGRPRLRWLAAAATGGLLLGGLVTGVTMTLWSRRRVRKP